MLVILKNDRSNHPEVFLEKVVLQICSNLAGEHACRSAIRIPLNGCFWNEVKVNI